MLRQPLDRACKEIDASIVAFGNVRAGRSEIQRRQQLRHITERYVKVVRGQGHDVRTLVGQLSELVTDHALSAGDGRG